jgi:KGK domain
MPLISIAPKIYDRTRPPHQSNDKRSIYTPKIFSHYKIMTDLHTQIIPNSQAVVSFFDSEILELLDSHGTFTINELLKIIKISGIDRTSFRDELRNLIISMQKESHNVPALLSKLTTFVDGDKINESRYTSYEILRKMLFDSTECTLLQADEKGWQKGKLKICFEFILEEDEPIATKEKPVESHSSPLDEIRQLSNELTSMVSIEQN